ncbi:MAG: hypothetical protein QM820_06300 [Minicystis sp.]
MSELVDNGEAALGLALPERRNGRCGQAVEDADDLLRRRHFEEDIAELDAITIAQAMAGRANAVHERAVGGALVGHDPAVLDRRKPRVAPGYPVVRENQNRSSRGARRRISAWRGIENGMRPVPRTTRCIMPTSEACPCHAFPVKANFCLASPLDFSARDGSLQPLRCPSMVLFNR